MLTRLILSTVAVVNLIDIGDLDRFLEKEVFASAFSPGERVVFDSKSCVGRICDQSQFQYLVESVRGDEATIAALRMDGSKIGENKFTETYWNENLHSLTRIRIKNLESYGFRVEVQSVVPSQAAILDHGKTRTIETRVVTLSCENGIGMHLTITLEIAAGIGGIAQIIRSVEDRGSSSESFTLRALMR